MPLFGKKAKGKTTKLFFVTDVHGSQTTFRKFINAGKFYEVDVLVLGGDIAGKMVVPILDLGGGKYRATIQSITHELDGGDEVADFEKRAAKLGSYTAVVTATSTRPRRRPGGSTTSTTGSRPSGWRSGSSSPRSAWPAPASAATSPAATTTPPTSSSRSWHDGTSVIDCEEKQVLIDDDEHLMLSTGLSNPTPWDTPREVPDDELRGTSKASSPASRTSRASSSTSTRRRRTARWTRRRSSTGRRTRPRSSPRAARR